MAGCSLKSRLSFEYILAFWFSVYGMYLLEKKSIVKRESITPHFLHSIKIMNRGHDLPIHF